MLIVTELAEACEALRKNNRQEKNNGTVTFFEGSNRTTTCCNIWKKDTFEDELADTLIRIFDLCHKMNINIEEFILMKIDTSNWIKGKNYYDWNDDISLSILSNGYLLPHEDIKIAFKRVSKAAARRLRKRELQPYFLEAMEKNWLCLASPVLSNMGTERGLPISCFTIHVDDSIEGIADANSELMRLASQGGGVGMYIGEIRGRGELIKDNGVSEGVVPWLKIYDSTTLATNQGSVRRGATAFYLDINHRDIEEFLMIRRPKGDINRQCLNSHHAVVITDEFMEAVENKIPEAQKLWAEILKTRLETGEPYMMFKDNVNKANPEGYKRLGLEVASSNICVTGDSIITILLPDNTIKEIEIQDLEYYLTNFEEIKVLSYNENTKQQEYQKITNFGLTNESADVLEIGRASCRERV
jgi:ribonucleotide reductase alpha subunit